MRIVFYIITLCCIALGGYAYFFITSLNIDSILLEIGTLVLYCIFVNIFVWLVTKLVSIFTKIKIETDDCYYSKVMFVVAYALTMFIVSGKITDYELIGRIIVTIIVTLPPIIINMYLAYPKDDSYVPSSYSSNYGSGYGSNYSSSYSSYTPSYKKRDENIRVERSIFGDKIYKDSHGNVVARGERGIFGDEIIRDKQGNEIMRGERNIFGDVNYRDKDYNTVYRKEYGIFGDAKIKDSHGDVKYTEEFDIFGDSKISKKWLCFYLIIFCFIYRQKHFIYVKKIKILKK